MTDAPQNLKVEFVVEGVFDGPVSKRLLDEGKGTEWFAGQVASDLRALIENEMKSEDDRYGVRVNVRTKATLYRADASVGEASTQ